MRTVYATPGRALDIGRYPENDTVKVVFDVKCWRGQYPAGNIALLHQRPGDDGAQPVAGLTVGENNAEWLVSNADVLTAGEGIATLILVNGEQVALSESWKTVIGEPVTEESETPPEPIASYMTAVIEAVESYDAMTAEAEEGETADSEIDRTGDHPVLRLTLPRGRQGDPGDPGEPGDDGFSPVVTVEAITGGHRVTITDATGPHVFDVMDGQGGSGGGAVESVNGKTGAVVLNANDVGALPDSTPIPPAVTVDSELSGTSTNPVQNKVIAGALSSQSETIVQLTGAVDDLSDEVDALPWTDDSTASGPDLDVSDEDGNVLVRMKNGQIQTKEFDSSKAPTTSGSSGKADFDLADENGNVLLRLKDGNIYTKNLDSGALNDDFYFGCENRLANPLYETFEHYNDENTENPIVREVALSRNMLDPTASEYRIPAVAITNAGTIIVCGQRMKNPIGDYGDFGIDISRKEVGGSWSASVLIPFDSTRESYGHTENVSILVDRNNDRIYVFYGTFMDNVVWWEETTAGCDYKYVYSDDDGETWSEPVSLKNKWDTTKYKLCIPSCSQGIVLTDGTFVVPSMCVISTNPNTSSPVILYKTPNGDWTFSDIVQIPGVVMMDECAVVEGSNNQIRLYCRPNYNYKKGANRSYHEFIYNISRNTFTQIPSTFNANRGNFMGIDAITINNKKIYLMSFTDTHGDVRENGTLWASLDGQKWIRVFRYLKEASAGYSVLTNYNGQLVVAFEYQSTYGGAIAVEDLTDLLELIEDSAALIGRNISVQDHIQMLYNAVNGIE